MFRTPRRDRQSRSSAERLELDHPGLHLPLSSGARPRVKSSTTQLSTEPPHPTEDEFPELPRGPLPETPPRLVSPQPPAAAENTAPVHYAISLPATPISQHTASHNTSICARQAISEHLPPSSSQRAPIWTGPVTWVEGGRRFRRRRGRRRGTGYSSRLSEEIKPDTFDDGKDQSLLNPASTQQLAAPRSSSMPIFPSSSHGHPHVSSPPPPPSPTSTVARFPDDPRGPSSWPIVHSTSKQRRKSSSTLLSEIGNSVAQSVRGNFDSGESLQEEKITDHSTTSPILGLTPPANPLPINQINPIDNQSDFWPKYRDTVRERMLREREETPDVYTSDDSVTGFDQLEPRAVANTSVQPPGPGPAPFRPTSGVPLQQNPQARNSQINASRLTNGKLGMLSS